jgi:hypothetical protein
MVAGHNANGEPDFFFVIVRCSDAEFKAADHYARARRAASAEGYDPALCFDEFDSAGKMLLHHFEWRSASIVSCEGESFYIWSREHQAWWGPNRYGYTRDLAGAGRYSDTETQEIIGEANLVGFQECAMPASVIDQMEDSIRQVIQDL